MDGWLVAWFGWTECYSASVSMLSSMQTLTGISATVYFSVCQSVSECVCCSGCMRACVCLCEGARRKLQLGARAHRWSRVLMQHEAHIYANVAGDKQTRTRTHLTERERAGCQYRTCAGATTGYGPSTHTPARRQTASHYTVADRLTGAPPDPDRGAHQDRRRQGVCQVKPGTNANIVHTTMENCMVMLINGNECVCVCATKVRAVILFQKHTRTQTFGRAPVRMGCTPAHRDGRRFNRAQTQFAR